MQQHREVPFVDGREVVGVAEASARSAATTPRPRRGAAIF